jgi:hypothetical protein
MNKINIYELSVNEDDDKIIIGIDKTIKLGADLDEFIDFKNIKY